MVRFKTVKFKHYRAAQALNKRIDAKEATDEDTLLFALALVKEWDFVDEDTGEPLPPEVEFLDELSVEQCGELAGAFARKMEAVTAVPKENA